MAKKFHYRYSENSKPEKSDTVDDSWLLMAEKIPAESFRSNSRRELFIPAIPHKFLSQVRPASDALELMLVVLAEMRMRGIQEIAIGSRIWGFVGNPGRGVRSRILRQISLLPDSLCTVIPRTGKSHLLIAGVDWPQPLTNKH